MIKFFKILNFLMLKSNFFKMLEVKIKNIFKKKDLKNELFKIMFF